MAENKWTSKTACVHANKTPDRDGMVRWRTDDSYRCNYPLPEIVLPNSITKSYGYQVPQTGKTVFINMCADCPCYKAR